MLERMTPRAGVAVVGGGILGLAHAYVLAQSNLRVVLFERNSRLYAWFVPKQIACLKRCPAVRSVPEWEVAPAVKADALAKADRGLRAACVHYVPDSALGGLRIVDEIKARPAAGERP